MEEVAYLFNGDFEKVLFSKKQKIMASSKETQEFESFIAYLDPHKHIFTTKKESISFLENFSLITGESYLTCNKAKEIIPWCSDYGNVETLLFLQDKVQTIKFLKENKLIEHHAEILSPGDVLKEDFLYKDPYSLSGMGHYSYPLHEKRIQKLLRINNPIIEEELLNRTEDFSHLIDHNKVVCKYINYVDDYFQYKGTYITDDFEWESSLDERMKSALALILNYTSKHSGPMSIDGFLFEKDGIKSIHPCCEINARKTMGYFAYHFKERYYPDFKHFKILLHRNSRQINSYEYFKDKNVNLLSPLDNRFYVFSLAVKSSEEMKNMEYELFSTFF